jgi:hypothetical protein
VKKEGEKRKNKYFLKVRVTKTGSWLQFYELLSVAHLIIDRRTSAVSKHVRI